MITQRTANLVFAVFVLIACAYFGWLAEGFEAAGLLASSGLPSKFFPQLTLAFTGLCAAVVAALYALRGSAGGDDEKLLFADAGEVRRGLLMLAVAIACYFIWSNFGFIYMIVALGPLSLASMGVRTIWTYVTVLALTGLIFAVFSNLLGVQFT